MTPIHDHATLFLAPPTSPAGGAADRTESAVDGGPAAMRRLRDPFAVHAARTTASAETRRAL